MATLPNRLGAPPLVQSLRYGFDREGFFAAARRHHGEIFTAQVIDETWSPKRPPKTINAASGRMLAVSSHCASPIEA